jgi:hypothetical protein
METISVKELEDRLIITLPPSPKSSYSIFFYLISILLIGLIVYICLSFFPKFILAFGVALIPIALLIFNFKINVWNVFGVETLVIHPKKLTSELNYRYIYKIKTTEFEKKKSKILLLSSKDGQKIALDDPSFNEHKKNRFRIVLENDSKKSYQSTNFITYDDVIKLKAFLIKN